MKQQVIIMIEDYRVTESLRYLSRDYITAIEEGRAIERLRKIAEIDPNSITTLDDLSARVSLTGDDLRTLIITRGEVNIAAYQAYHPKTGTPIRKEVIQRRIYKKVEDELGERETIATYSDKKETATIVLLNNRKQTATEIQLPLGRDIAISYKPDDARKTYAETGKWYRGDTVFPVLHPSDSNVQQQYMRTLQECLREVLLCLNCQTLSTKLSIGVN